MKGNSIPVMTTSEERFSILKKIQEGSLTSEEGVKSLNALERGESSPIGNTEGNFNSAMGRSRWMRVMILDLDTSREKINIRLPVNVVEAGYRMGARYVPYKWSENSAKILRATRSGKTGTVVDASDIKSRERIVIILE
jgi:hypothetical protein